MSTPLVTQGLGSFSTAALLLTGGLGANTTVVAISTSASSRLSAMNMTMPWRGIGHLPDGAPGAADRRDLLDWYSRASVVLSTATGFIMDISTLAGGQYRTVPFEMQGEFRQVQFGWRQTVASQDMEPHYLEFHYTVVGVSEEL